MTATVDLDSVRRRLDADYAPDWGILALPKDEIRALVEIADDALALLDQHISEEQRRELGVRIVARLA